MKKYYVALVMQENLKVDGVVNKSPKFLPVFDTIKELEEYYPDAKHFEIEVTQ